MKAVVVFARLFVSAAIVWLLELVVYLGSYAVSTSLSPALQANIALCIAAPLFIWLAAIYYYSSGLRTVGFMAGIGIFVIAGSFDAIITVPVFILPEGGTYEEFFTDPWFWVIGIEFVSVVTAYWACNVRGEDCTTEEERLIASG